MSIRHCRRFWRDRSVMGYGLLLSLFGLVAIGIVTAAGSQENVITKETMESVLRQHVLQHGPWSPENVEVRILSFQPVSLPGGKASFRVVRPTQGVTPGMQAFLVVADVAGREAGRLRLRADIKIFEEVVITSFPLLNRQLVKAKDVRMERRDVSSLTARPFTRIDEVLGQQAVRAIDVNEILTQKSVDRPNLVRRGSSITLLYETGNLRVETPGTAEENGKVGDLIQVKNPTSGKAMRGLVLDGRTVRVN